ncbi:MAG: hypothetical protein LBD18_04585 [Treponema sp.]|nr:hypothetical protein [Treponema sp.]
MKSSIKLVCVFTVLSLLGMGISAQTKGARFGEVFPRIEPEPQAVEYAQKAINGGYSWINLAEISLWASDAALAMNVAARGGRPAYMEQIVAAVKELRSMPELPLAERERADFILSFLHQNFLKTYSRNQTRIDTLLNTGRYNCVSSAVLYMIFAMSVDLDVSGVMTKDHAFALVHSGGESIDVETTNPWGFDPGNRREFHDQFGKLTGFAYVPARNYRDRAFISPIELVSLILSNRISELESGSRFAEAVPLAVDRAALLAYSPKTNGIRGVDSPAPFFEDPRRDMMNRIFNYGAFLLNTGKEEDCLRWAAFAAPRYPEDARWQEFTMAAANNRIQKLVESGQLSVAREFLVWQKASISPANYTLLDSLLTDAELVNSALKILDVYEGDRILAAIEQAKHSKLINDKRAAELITFTVQKTAAALSAVPRRDWLASIDYIEKAITRFGPNQDLEYSLRTYQTNRAKDFHNRFAAAWNTKNYEEAERIIIEGLSEFPNNKLLLADKKFLE